MRKWQHECQLFWGKIRCANAHLLLRALSAQVMSLETRIEMLGNPSSEFYISDYELHDLLTDEADRNAKFWDFHHSGLEKFAQKIIKLYAVSNGGFTLQAIWSGDKISNVENLSLEEFLEIVRSNRIGTKTKYVVVGGT